MALNYLNIKQGGYNEKNPLNLGKHKNGNESVRTFQDRVDFLIPIKDAFFGRYPFQMFCNQRSVSIKDNIIIDCCAEIHVMHNGVLGFQPTGALKVGVIFLRLDLFGT